MRDRARQQPTEQFGPFLVHECLGVGGMATVHRATLEIGLGLERELALKRLLPQLDDEPAFVTDFVREAKLAVQLDHPNVVKIFELGRVGHAYFIAMELVRGRPLDRVLTAARDAGIRVPLGVALALLIELCDALDYTASAIDDRGEPLRVVHRDVSPSNLIVTDGGHLKVIDFGVATAASGRFATDTGLVKGKLGYMAPEATSIPDELDARADIFSAGVVAWEMITGQRLRRDIAWDHVSTVIQPPSDFVLRCPRALDRVVMTALAQDRDRRWQTAGAMRDALEALREARRELASPAAVARWATEVAAAQAQRHEDVPTRSGKARSSAVTRRFMPTWQASHCGVL